MGILPVREALLFLTTGTVLPATVAFVDAGEICAVAVSATVGAKHGDRAESIALVVDFVRLLVVTGLPVAATGSAAK